MGILTLLLTLCWVGSYAQSGICGDANDDGTVNILDISFLNDYLFRGGSEPDKVNTDGIDGFAGTNIGDLNLLVGNAFVGCPDPICPESLQTELPVNTDTLYIINDPISSGQTTQIVEIRYRAADGRICPSAFSLILKYTGNARDYGIDSVSFDGSIYFSETLNVLKTAKIDSSGHKLVIAAVYPGDIDVAEGLIARIYISGFNSALYDPYFIFDTVSVFPPENINIMAGYCDDAIYPFLPNISELTPFYDFCGDVNQSGSIDLLDILYMIDCLYSADLCPYELMDINSDGNFNILDVVYMITFVYQGGPAPVCIEQ